MNRTISTALAALVTAMTVTACSEKAGPTDIAEPGVLVASITIPNPDDRAILVEISGPGITAAEAAGSDVLLHARTTGQVLRGAAFGNLQSGALVRFRVPDARATSLYTGRVVEASGPQNELRTDLTGYGVALVRQP
jgi:hypothetical protein